MLKRRSIEHIDYLKRSYEGLRGALKVNDHVMVHNICKDIATAEAPYGYIDREELTPLNQEWEKGVEQIYECQIDKNNIDLRELKRQTVIDWILETGRNLMHQLEEFFEKNSKKYDRHINALLTGGSFISLSTALALIYIEPSGNISEGFEAIKDLSIDKLISKSGLMRPKTQKIKGCLSLLGDQIG
jgi:hypothetical protein